MNTPHCTRRQFLAASTAAVAATTAWAKPARPLVGSQLYGWGQYYQRDGKVLNTHLDEIFAALRDAGYDYAEGSLDVARPEANAVFADKLKAKGLRPVSLYTGGALHTAALAEKTVEKLLIAAKVCKVAGFSMLTFNPDPIGRDKTDAELTVQAAALKRLGAGLGELGLRLGIHHHTPEMRNGAREFHSNFKKCPGDQVGFCCDVHWIFRGGLPPLDAIKDYGDRILSWHLRQSRQKTWWEDLDTGDIDFAAIAAQVRARLLQTFYTVELALEAGTKITRTVVENHRRSREFVRQTFGG